MGGWYSARITMTRGAWISMSVLFFNMSQSLLWYAPHFNATIFDFGRVKSISAILAYGMLFTQLGTTHWHVTSVQVVAHRKASM